MANARPAYNGVALPGGAAYQSRCRQVTTFNGVSQYFTHPSITPVNITLDVNPISGGNTGLPTGCPALTDGIRQQVSFAFAGALTEIGRNGASHFNGDIYSVTYDSGETYPLNDGYANNPVVRNAATELGAELVVNGDFTDGTNNWSAQNGASIAVSDNILTLTGGTTSNPLVRQNITTVIGETYLVGFTSSKTSSLTLRVFAQEEGGGYAVLSQLDKTTDDTESLRILFTATTTSTRINFFLNGTDEGGQFKLYNVSSKEADGYGQMINPTEAMWSERCDL